jgi:pimeloyl-ACP methyl ester carboxylesterase
LLVGTTHPRDVDLSKLKWPVTKIVGTQDGIAPLEKVEANRHLLPASTRWVRIEGGNHSQFGWYGFQPFDHFATISRDEQHAQLIREIIESLRQAGEPRQAMRP